jgi:hypothetical protein
LIRMRIATEDANVFSGNKSVEFSMPCLAHERQHACIHSQFGNRGDILEHQELLTASTPGAGFCSVQAGH